MMGHRCRCRILGPVVATVVVLVMLYAPNLKLIVHQAITSDGPETSVRGWLPHNYDIASYIKDVSLKHNFTEDDLVRRFNVSSNGSDIIIFMRIMKTGSATLRRHMSNDIDLHAACGCSPDEPPCPCVEDWRSKVLVEKVCGVHAGYRLLLSCTKKLMDKRLGEGQKGRIFFTTMVRDPIRRYLSEWIQVRTHGQWGTSPVECQYPTASAIWVNVTLEQFIKCPTNPAINRQTQMLAISYGSRKKFQLVKNAMNNLKKFAFFGITEHQELSQILFEHTFNIRFTKGFETLPQRAAKKKSYITEEQCSQIIEWNRLDGMLFDYGKDLFRLRILKLFETTNDIALKDRLRVLSMPLFENIERKTLEC